MEYLFILIGVVGVICSISLRNRLVHAGTTSDENISSRIMTLELELSKLESKFASFNQSAQSKGLNSEVVENDLKIINDHIEKEQVVAAQLQWLGECDNLYFIDGQDKTRWAS